MATTSEPSAASRIALPQSRDTADPAQRTLFVGADPAPAAIALFAFALLIYGVRFITVKDATIATGPVTIGLDYAVLAASIAEVICAVLALLRGETYPAYVLGVFGLWLTGFFFLVTAGAANKAFTTDAIAWYCFAFVIPVVILAVPAIVTRNITFIVAFIGLTGLLLFLGFGNHDVYNALNTAAATKSAPDLSSAITLLKASAIGSFVGAAALLWYFADETYRAIGVLPARRR